MDLIIKIFLEQQHVLQVTQVTTNIQNFVNTFVIKCLMAYLTLPIFKFAQKKTELQ